MMNFIQVVIVEIEKGIEKDPVIFLCSTGDYLRLDFTLDKT